MQVSLVNLSQSKTFISLFSPVTQSEIFVDNIILRLFNANPSLYIDVCFSKTYFDIGGYEPFPTWLGEDAEWIWKSD